VQRDDDSEQTIHERLRVYHEQTEPLVEYYCSLAQRTDGPVFHRVEASGTVAEVRQEIQKLL